MGYRAQLHARRTPPIREWVAARAKRAVLKAPIGIVTGLSRTSLRPSRSEIVRVTVVIAPSRRPSPLT